VVSRLLIYGAYLVPETSDSEARAGWLEYARAAKEAGILLGAEQLTRTDTATSVRVRSGRRLLTDGPFLETKEHIGGFWILEAADMDEALA
jgi:hypothetical protein